MLYFQAQRADKGGVVTIPLYERVLAADMLGEIEQKPLAELRALRAECERLEAAISFTRRILHGRIDIVEHERSRRRVGGRSSTLAELLDHLPAILAGNRYGTPGRSGRLMVTPEADSIQAELVEQMDAIAGPMTMGRVVELGDDDLERISSELSELEEAQSRIRRRLHAHIDLLQLEITVRYQTGHASLESLLR